ncbi:hypothetical protein M9R32_10485 [Paenisporosarcina quisquiliarum]|uniref:Uncharacterized protein n=1 Tax=Paenisporosarcina quisquiliarum TaxID=365346 RepID=A0A9X3LJG1_9BACL|nr:hypothetical protein [Paenisporosarcina quisquiliarum]MCZ8537609.1 hypothetical protein [Paenisporosarcina quisquiliarum]
MKKLMIILLAFATVALTFSLIPFLLNYPYSNSENSGPANFWELINMMAYEHKFLLPGIIALFAGLILFYKHKKYEDTP